MEKLSGTILKSPVFMASIAGFAISSMRTNHWGFTIGSTVVLQRSWVPTLWEWGTTFTKRPSFFKSSTMAFLASYRSMPS